MRRLVALVRNLYADTFNRKYGPAQGSKTSRHKRFILEGLETRVLLSADLVAPLIDPTEPASGAEVSQPLTIDEINGDKPAASWGDVESDGDDEGEHEEEEEIIFPPDDVVVEPELGPGTNLAVGLTGNEPTIAVNPLNPNNVVVAQFNSGAQTLKISLDGGSSFPIVRNAVLVPGQTFFQGDDSLAFDSAGRLFWSYLSGGTPAGPNVSVVQVNPTTGAIVGSPTLVATTNLDKEWLAADANPASPFANNLYVVWHDFAQTNAPVRFARSTDQGVTWTTLPGNLSGAAEGFTWPSEVAVAPNGDVFVAWHTNTGVTNGEVRMRRSTDGGLTFGPEIIPFPAGTAATTTNSGTGLASKITGLHVWLQGSMQPRILIDPVRPGNIYVVSVDDPDTFDPTNDPSDIVFARSSDNGATWTRSTISQGLNGDSEFMPSASINSSGNLTVTWYDTRRHLTVPDSLGGTHFLLDLLAVTSFDGGLTFSYPILVNDAANAFDPERGAPDRFGNHTLRIGEYNGVVLVDTAANAVWTGNTATGQQIYYDRYSTGLAVGSTVPGSGSVVVGAPPTTFIVNVSSPIVPATVQASDLKVNGIAADSFSYVPGTTAISFSFVSSPVIAQGLQAIHIDAGAFTRAFDDDPVRQFDGTFRYDAVLLQVTSTVPPVGGVFTLPGPFTYDVNFSEAVDPATVQASDFQLSGIIGAAASAVTLLPGNTTARFTLTGITNEGTLTVSVAAGAMNDVFGNPGAAFSGAYAVDLVTASYPTPLTAKTPLGSLIYDPSQAGFISFAGDVDSFTLNVDPNQTISLVLTPTPPSPPTPGSSPTLQPRIELFDPNNVSQGFAIAPVAGQIAGIETRAASLGGVYTFAVTGVGGTVGGYTLQVILNSAFELEGNVGGSTNNTLTSTVQTINAVDSGWILSDGTHTATNSNYSVGQTLFPLQFRNYTTFNLPAAMPTVIGAELRLFNPASSYSSPDPTETYTLFDVNATPAALDTTRLAGDAAGITIFGDLGTGTVYGTRIVSAADNNTTVAIPLNAAAVAALNAAIGSAISFGGAITTLAGTAPQLMFGGASGDFGTVQLVLQTATPVTTAESIDSSFITVSTPQASAQRGAVLGQTDVVNYSASAAAFAFEDISATGAVIAGLTNQDNASVSIPVGFTFPFYGVNNTTVFVSSNGLLTFGASNSSLINADLTLAPTTAAIAPFWDDLHTNGGASSSNVFSQVLGSGANQHLTIQWNNVRFFSGGTAGDTITFEVQLYADGRIQFNYLDLASGTAVGNNGASATVGIKAIGTQGSNRLLLAFNNGPNAFVGTGKSTLITRNPTPDYYAFTVNTGETATLAVTGVAPNLTVELRDSSDAVLATGVGGPTNLTSVISDFAVATGGTYYARVTGGNGTTSAPYSLVVTRNAAFDREDNNTAATAQSLGVNQGVLGQTGSSAILYGSTRGGQLFTINLSTGVGALVGNLPNSTTEIEFDNSTGRAFAQAPDGSFFGQEFNINTGAGIGSTISNGASFTGMEWVGSTLYATAFMGPGTLSTLRTLNPFTGTSTTIGSTGFGPIAGLAFNPSSGIMYGITGGATGNLLQLNLTTGVATQIGPTGFRAGSLEFGPDGLLYGGGTGSDESKIFRINPATGASTLVGTTGIGALGTADVTGLALVLAGSDDWYSITLPSTGNALRLETSTPGDGPGEPVNTLNPTIDLYDSTGTTLLASGVAGPDGRNESILFTGQTPGATYKVRVKGEGGTKGEYFLTSHLVFAVTTTTPAVGSVVSAIPVDYVVNFSDAINAGTVDATDFMVDGVLADSFILNSPTQVTFHFVSAPFSTQALHTMAIAQGAILRTSDGDALAPFSGTFRYDAVFLQVTSTVPPVGGAFTLPGPFTYDMNFNEAVDPASVQTSDLVLSGISGGFVSAVTVLPGNTTARFTLSGITAQGLLTASMMAGDITDAFGNTGAAFSSTYSVDIDTESYPTPLTAKDPAGSLIYDPSLAGFISFAGDLDSYTLNVDPNQTISLILTPTSPSLQPRIELFDPNKVSQGFAVAPAAGQIAGIETKAASLGGVYTFAVTGGGTVGGYTLQVILNSAFELEDKVVGSTNNNLVTAQSIDGSFITVSTPQASAQRGAVGGQTDVGNYTATASLFAFEDISATGTVIAGLTNQDNTSASIPIGFTFPFYGVNNTTVTVSSNGLLTFGLGGSTPVNSDLTTTPGQATIAPFWDDLHTGGGVLGSDVFSQVLGSGANQRLDIQWNNVRFLGGGAAGDTITFEAQLYADGRIQFNYLDLVSGVASGNDGASATVGIKAIGTQGPNRLLLAFNNGPNAFVGSGKSTLITPPVPTDYYSFSLNAGETATLAVTGVAPNLTVELRDSSDAVLATGVSGSSNLTSVISDFAVATGGTYYARITGGNGMTSVPYSLVVTRNAAFDTEGNNTPATAQTLTGTQGSLGAILLVENINAVDSGWIRADGVHTASNNNYIVGQSPVFPTSAVLESRNYVTFTLPAATQTITGAELRLFNPGPPTVPFPGYNSPDPVETYTLFDVSATPADLDATRVAGDATGITLFGDLGSGTVYGTRVVSGADNNTTVAITLNAAAVAALNAAIGSTISLGGAITTLAGTATQFMFGGSTGTPGTVQLVLQSVTEHDWYSITMPSTGNALRLETSTPGDGPGEPVNTLDPTIDLYDGTGTTLVASGVAGPDGRNEFIAATGLTPGATYKVLVSSEGGTGGEYLLTRNFSPVVTNVTTSPINENDSATVSGTFSDPDSLDTHTVVITWGSGEGSTTLTLAAGVFAFSATHQYLDDNPTGTLSDVYPISVTVSDNHGASGTGSANLTVNNGAPVVAGVSGPASGVRGQTLDFSSSFTDVGSLDTHEVRWDFGDGTVIDFHSTTDPNALTADHIYTASGVYTLTLSIRDDDGGVTTVSKDVTVTAMAIQTDPCDPDKTALVVGGTTANDIISFTPQGNDGNIILSINGVSQGIFHPTGHLIVYGQAGDDNIQVAGSIAAEAWLYGDAGNDFLKGGAGASILLGGDGDDELKGGTGRSILIGGRGRDKATGGSDEDILIGGFVNFNRNAAILCSLLEEWNSTADGYAVRVGRLRLHLNGTSVFDDGEVDTLSGSSGLDWFLDGEGDVIAKIQDGEITG